ncbi:hypothetical protein G4Z16_25390 [Streptomyces bathyalis]|uniref:Uncharacterized protein n=1 Tax=Streptomyces bathyalis TaxID=2710756 RepID=A0A7T1TA53_9ACTN|nr:hypothetical protein [Streptomyces bathyalis]QPP09194.1 hypothetical protein G4Z16_25390 [Streptomyces bathyalis]
MNTPERIAVLASDQARPSLHTWLTESGYEPHSWTTGTPPVHRLTTLISYLPTLDSTTAAVLPALPLLSPPATWVQLGPLPLAHAAGLAERTAAAGARYIHVPYVQQPGTLTPDPPLCVAFTWADDPLADLICALTSPLRLWAGPLKDRTAPGPDDVDALTDLMTTTDDSHPREDS